MNITQKTIKNIEKIKSNLGYRMSDEEYDCLKEALAFLKNITDDKNYDKSTYIYNAIVRVKENTETGVTNIDWISNDDTYEEIVYGYNEDDGFF